MKGETAIGLDVLVWIGSFAAGIAIPRYVFEWSWWFAVPVGIVGGFLLYLPIWFVLVYLLHFFGLVKPERSEHVRAPHNLGRPPERRE